MRKRLLSMLQADAFPIVLKAFKVVFQWQQCVGAWSKYKNLQVQTAETLFQFCLKFTLNAARYVWSGRDLGVSWQKHVFSLFSFPTMLWTNPGHLPLSVVSSSRSLNLRASGPGRGTWPSVWPPLLSPGLHSSPGSPVETRTGHEQSSSAENRASSKGRLTQLQESLGSTGTAAFVTGTHLWSSYNSKNVAAAQTPKFLQ